MMEKSWWTPTLTRVGSPVNQRSETLVFRGKASSRPKTHQYQCYQEQLKSCGQTKQTKLGARLLNKKKSNEGAKAITRALLYKKGFQGEYQGQTKLSACAPMEKKQSGRKPRGNQAWCACTEEKKAIRQQTKGKPNLVRAQLHTEEKKSYQGANQGQTKLGARTLKVVKAIRQQTKGKSSSVRIH